MEITNGFIAEKIKSTRVEKGLTQKELATELGKTTGAISQLEQGNVQITAVDLYKLSILLNKPIEFFFGAEYLGEDIQALITMVQNMPPKVRKDQFETVFMILQLQSLTKELENTDDKEIEEKIAKDFYKSFAPFVITINNMTKQVNEIKGKLEEVLKIDEIDNK